LLCKYSSQINTRAPRFIAWHPLILALDDPN
jgi:hypothetical protein